MTPGALKLRALIGLLWCLVAGAAYPAEPLKLPPNLIVPYSVQIRGKWYTALVIRPLFHYQKAYGSLDGFDWDYLRSTPAARWNEVSPHVAHLLGFHKDWLGRLYHLRQTVPSESSDDITAGMGLLRSMLDGRSSYVVFTEYGEPHKVLSFLRFAVATDASPEVPVEADMRAHGLEAKLPASRIRFEESEEPVYALNRRDPKHPILHARSSWWTGAAAEAMHFAQEKDAPEDFIAHMYFLAEIHQLTRWSGLSVPMEQWPPALGIQRKIHELGHWNLSNNPGGYGVRIDRYLVKCTRFGRRLYLGWNLPDGRGFEEVGSYHDEKLGIPIHVLAISREDWAAVLGERLFARPDASTIRDARYVFDPELFSRVRLNAHPDLPPPVSPATTMTREQAAMQWLYQQRGYLNTLVPLLDRIQTWYRSTGNYWRAYYETVANGGILPRDPPARSIVGIDGQLHVAAVQALLVREAGHLEWALQNQLAPFDELQRLTQRLVAQGPLFREGLRAQMPSYDIISRLEQVLFDSAQFAAHFPRAIEAFYPEDCPPSPADGIDANHLWLADKVSRFAKAIYRGDEERALAALLRHVDFALADGARPAFDVERLKTDLLELLQQRADLPALLALMDVEPSRSATFREERLETALSLVARSPELVEQVRGDHKLKRELARKARESGCSSALVQIARRVAPYARLPKR